MVNCKRDVCGQAGHGRAERQLAAGILQISPDWQGRHRGKGKAGHVRRLSARCLMSGGSGQGRAVGVYSGCLECVSTVSVGV